MSSRVNVVKVDFLNNPAKFTDGFNVEIIFEAQEDLPGDLEWELTYVGTPSSSEKDQVLETILIGPIREGRHKFQLEAEAPKPELIPEDDVIGVTALLLTCKYNDQQFLKIGYFVSIDYTTEELRENRPEEIDFAQLERCVKEEDVRVHYNIIKWIEEEPIEEEPIEENQNQEDENMEKENQENEAVEVTSKMDVEDVVAEEPEPQSVEE
ncbi:hypothetical protein L596_003128 [Steinernema carpocapsae]|uniref:Anti-silencing function protein 1 n=1 Tax=Steinernema carpocapsae TaxID=34508 RepID=A0A4V6I7W4_STECR|nr:hypothetical protein L596_003128 [Steinernema carpocapsae]